MLIVMAGTARRRARARSPRSSATGSGIPVISVDPIESAILSAGIDSDQPTGLAAYLVAETMAESVLVGGGGVIVDAVNAVEPAREQWVQLAARQEAAIRFVEVVCSDPELHRERRRGARPQARPPRRADLARGRAEPRRVGGLDRPERRRGRASPSTRSGPLGANVEQALAFLEPAVD